MIEKFGAEILLFTGVGGAISDGFKIAEFDLKQRGPGDFFGTKQSGVPSFKVADLINDVDLMYLAKKLALKIIEVTDNKQRLLQYIGLNETII